MKLLTILITTGLCSLRCFSQTDNSENKTGIPVAATTDTTETKASLTLGITYSNDASYYGQRAQEKNPYIAAGATYRFKSGIYISGLAYRLLNDTGAFVSASNIGGGIAFKVSKKLSADLGYNHTFYPSYSPLLQASSPDNASAGLTYENWLTTSATLDLAFGKTTDLFFTLGISKQLSLGSIGKKDVITLTPGFDVVAGTQHFYQSYITEKKLRDSLLGVLVPPIFGQPPAEDNITTTTTTKVNLLSYNFKFPLAYNRTNYMLEASYQLSILSKDAETGAGSANSFLSVSFYYQF